MKNSSSIVPTVPETLAQRRERLIAQVHLQRLQCRAECLGLAGSVRPLRHVGARLARGVAIRVAVGVLRRGLRALRRRMSAAG